MAVTHAVAAPPPRARRFGRRLPRSFFERPTLTVARELLGKALVYDPVGSPRAKGARAVDSSAGRRAARIVEVEAYIGREPASHARFGPTRRNFPMFGPGGFTYVYFIYGMHHCLNVSSEREGRGAAILVRGAEPLEGFAPGTRLDGPGLVCRAFRCTTAHSNLDLTRSTLSVRDAPLVPRGEVGRSRRIGVRDEKPWRFYVRASPGVSGPPSLRG